MILLYGANATGATILSLDDPEVPTDQGAEFEARLKSATFDTGPAAGFATFRRATQAVAVEGTATVTISVDGDGGNVSTQDYAETLDAAEGPEQLIEAPYDIGGTRFSVSVVVSAHDAAVELGEADQLFVKRRGTRS